MPEVLPAELHSAVSLGILLLASLAGGIVADLIRIPKVTAYLLAGMLVGPSVVDAISADHMHHLEPLTKLAMALVLLELGCQFRLTHLRPILKRALWLSLGQLLATFVIVTLSIWLFCGSWATGVLLGALALGTAAATTMAEYVVLIHSAMMKAMAPITGGSIIPPVEATASTAAANAGV